MNDQLFEMMLRKQDEIHDDIKAFAKRLDDHILDDQALRGEVNFIKRACQVTWGGLGMVLAWLGIRNS